MRISDIRAYMAPEETTTTSQQRVHVCLKIKPRRATPGARNVDHNKKVIYTGKTGRKRASTAYEGGHWYRLRETHEHSQEVNTGTTAT